MPAACLPCLATNRSSIIDFRSWTASQTGSNHLYCTNYSTIAVLPPAIGLGCLHRRVNFDHSSQSFHPFDPSLLFFPQSLIDFANRNSVIATSLTAIYLPYTWPPFANHFTSRELFFNFTLHGVTLHLILPGPIRRIASHHIKSNQTTLSGLFSILRIQSIVTSIIRLHLYKPSQSHSIKASYQNSHESAPFPRKRQSRFVDCSRVFSPLTRILTQISSVNTF